MRRYITSSSCPGSVKRAFFVSLTDHSLTVESLLADTRNEESTRAGINVHYSLIDEEKRV